MARIVVLGGTGYAGTGIVTEAAQRGHDVLSVSRTAPAELPAGAAHRAGDLRDEALLAEVLEGADVVIAASAPRGELAEPGVLRGIYATVARLVGEKGARFGVVGGAGSTLVAEGGPQVQDTPGFPDAFKAEANELTAVLEDLRADKTGLDWFFVSPAGGFGAYAPGERTGAYRTSDDVLLVDADGNSALSAEDLGVAIVDEIQQPSHRRARFHVAY